MKSISITVEFNRGVSESIKKIPETIEKRKYINDARRERIAGRQSGKSKKSLLCKWKLLLNGITGKAESKTYYIR